MLRVILKQNRDKPVRMGHPWIFSGSIESVEGEGSKGDLCTVVSHDKKPLGSGYYNSESAITVRMLTRDSRMFDAGLLRKRIMRSASDRSSILDNSTTDSCRLVNSEGDFLPGLIIDKFADGFGIQILTAGMERFRSDIITCLDELFNPAFIFERSDTEARRREGLVEKSGLVSGVIPGPLVIRENGYGFIIDPLAGQKTGYFFDQRNNRALLKTLTKDRTVCDCFSYSGAFSVAAVGGGAADVDAVDISGDALLWGRRNAELNGFQDRIRFEQADIFKYLRETDRKYDCIILDPPKFARHPGEVERASRGYKDINLLAFKNVNENGIVFTFSCSNAVDPYLFRQIVFGAAVDSGRSIQLLHTMTAGPDHPVNIAHKEGEYLKGLVLRVV